MLVTYYSVHYYEALLIPSLGLIINAVLFLMPTSYLQHCPPLNSCNNTPSYQKTNTIPLYADDTFFFSRVLQTHTSHGPLCDTAIHHLYSQLVATFHCILSLTQHVVTM